MLTKTLHLAYVNSTPLQTQSSPFPNPFATANADSRYPHSFSIGHVDLRPSRPWHASWRNTLPRSQTSFGCSPRLFAVGQVFSQKRRSPIRIPLLRPALDGPTAIIFVARSLGRCLPVSPDFVPTCAVQQDCNRVQLSVQPISNLDAPLRLGLITRSPRSRDPRFGLLGVSTFLAGRLGSQSALHNRDC